MPQSLKDVFGEMYGAMNRPPLQGISPQFDAAIKAIMGGMEKLPPGWQYGMGGVGKLPNMALTHQAIRNTAQESLSGYPDFNSAVAAAAQAYRLGNVSSAREILGTLELNYSTEGIQEAFQQAMQAMPRGLR